MEFATQDLAFSYNWHEHSSVFFIELQDGLGEKEIIELIWSNPCNKQGHLVLDQVVQSPLQPNLECFQDGASTTSLGSLDTATAIILFVFVLSPGQMLHTHCHMCQEDPHSSVSDTLRICRNHCFSAFIKAISKWHNPSAFYPSRSPVLVIFLLTSVVMFSFSKTWSKNVFYTLLPLIRTSFKLHQLNHMNIMGFVFQVPRASLTGIQLLSLFQ